MINISVLMEMMKKMMAEKIQMEVIALLKINHNLKNLKKMLKKINQMKQRILKVRKMEEKREKEMISKQMNNKIMLRSKVVMMKLRVIQLIKEMSPKLMSERWIELLLNLL